MKSLFFLELFVLSAMSSAGFAEFGGARGISSPCRADRDGSTSATGAGSAPRSAKARAADRGAGGNRQGSADLHHSGAGRSGCEVGHGRATQDSC